MSEDCRREVRTGLDPCLARLWRYALVLTGRSDAAEDLVQATCLRAVERADQFVPGTRPDRWLFAILRSIWLNEFARAAKAAGLSMRRTGLGPTANKRSKRISLPLRYLK
jgi:DNA-directed RNA polymerase specialized sigma24 family protein